MRMFGKTVPRFAFLVFWFLDSADSRISAEPRETRNAKLLRLQISADATAENVIQTGALLSHGTLMKITNVSRFALFVTGVAALAMLVALPMTAQQSQLPQSSQPMGAVPAAPPMPSDLGSALSNVDQAAQATAGSLKSLRIEKWKTDSSTKQHAQQNAESLSRNLPEALPGMIQQVRANPSSLAAQFKLYRNLNALFDVLSTMTEAAGTFGPKNEYETLAGELNNFEQARIALANRLQNSTAQQDAEIARLRTAVQQAQAAAQAAQAQIPPKKIVVDDNAPAKKKTTPTKKKSSAGTTAAKPANPPQ
jgi:hypothetical protein